MKREETEREGRKGRVEGEDGRGEDKGGEGGGGGEERGGESNAYEYRNAMHRELNSSEADKLSPSRRRKHHQT